MHDSICRALLIRAVRPDALCVALSEVVSSTFCRDDRFERSLGTTLDLDSIVFNECDPFTPLFLNCGAGFAVEFISIPVHVFLFLSSSCCLVHCLYLCAILMFDMTTCDSLLS